LIASYILDAKKEDSSALQIQKGERHFIENDGCRWIGTRKYQNQRVKISFPFISMRKAKASTLNES